MVTQLLAKARRRCLSHLALDESALALTIGMGGAVALLLAGTQILDWYWVVLLVAASLGTGLYRLRKRIPSNYKLAQGIDRKLKLADALSTAVYFSSDTAGGDEAVRNLQRREAETIARSVDLRAGLPFRRPRYVYPAVVLAVAACGLFALRFAMTGSLDLHPSLVTIALDTFFPATPDLAKATRPRDPRKAVAPDLGKPDAPLGNDPDAPQDMLDSTKPTDAARPDSADQTKAADKKDNPSNDPSTDDNQSKDSAKNDSKGNNPNQNEQADGKPPKDGKQSDADKESQQGANNENTSLVNKLKDAMSDMLSKIKPSPKGGQQAQQSAKNNQSGKPNQKDQKGQKSADQDPSNSDTQTDRNDNGDSSQSADAKGGKKSVDKNMPADSKTGAGSSDGDKTAKEAEQLQAMGKISEILGKRAQNVTGEVMVEVGSTKQQLKTPWAQREATHVEAGSEIHRDEIPLMYQQFVERYFEEIRKVPTNRNQ